MRFFVSLWIFLPKFFYLCSSVHFIVMLSITYLTSIFERTRICLMVSCPQTSITCVMFGALLFLDCSCVLISLTFVSILTVLLAEYAVHRFICFLSRMGRMSSGFSLTVVFLHFHPCFIISTFSIIIWFLSNKIGIFFLSYFFLQKRS